MPTRTKPLLHARRFTIRHATPRHQSISVVGASIGLLAFLFVGLYPSLVIGGAAGARLATGILGVRDAPSYGANALVVFGGLSTASISAALFAVLGAAVGAVVGMLVSDQRSYRKAP
jgi:hypothetical protein